MSYTFGKVVCPVLAKPSLATVLSPGSVSAGVSGPVTDMGDQIFTGDGNGTIAGGAGDDMIFAAYGANLLSGGLGHDSYSVVSADDVIVEAANAGTDTVWADVSYTLSDNIEIGRATRAGITLAVAAGSLLSVQPVGSTRGSSTLIGGGGDDVFVYDARGGWGNDNIFGYIPRTGLNGNEGSKPLFTIAVGPYAPVTVRVGGGNSYVFISQRPDLGTITIHGAVVQASDFLF